MVKNKETILLEQTPTMAERFCWSKLQQWQNDFAQEEFAPAGFICRCGSLLQQH